MRVVIITGAKIGRSQEPKQQLIARAGPGLDDLRGYKPIMDLKSFGDVRRSGWKASMWSWLRLQLLNDTANAKLQLYSYTDPLRDLLPTSHIVGYSPGHLSSPPPLE